MSELKHTCTACNHPIINGDGSLVLDNAELNAAEIDYRRRSVEKEAEKDITYTAADLDEVLANMPVLAHWREYHDECKPDFSAGVRYEITLDRLQTHEHLLAWDAHLLEKNWLYLTDWRYFVAGHAGPLP